MKKTIFSFIVLAALLLQPAAAAESITLSNGLKVILNPDRSAGIIALAVFVRAGSAYETPADSGTANLAFAMITRGTKTRSAEELAAATEALGVSIAASSGEDHSVISMVSTEKTFAEGSAVLFDMLLNPVFPEAELSKIKKVAISGLKAEKDDNFSYTLKRLKALMFKGDSYALDPLGTEENIAGVTSSVLSAFYSRNFTAGRICLSVSGSFDKGAMTALLEKSLSVIPAGGQFVKPQSAASAEAESFASEKMKKNQAVVMTGFFAPEFASADYPALKLLSSVLGGGMSSKLFSTLREKEGLAYSIGTIYPSRAKTCAFIFYAGTRKENIERIKQGFLDTAVNAGKPGYITEKELADAKNLLVGQFRLDHQTNADRARYLGWFELSGPGFGYDAAYPEAVKAVTLEEVSKAAVKYLVQPKTFVLDNE